MNFDETKNRVRFTWIIDVEHKQEVLNDFREANVTIMYSHFYKQISETSIKI